ncbi:MAG: hypothetical protein LAQ30_21095 [Acidobacteriia bacterium]|nr:hypothetical protein [Terriglobia bacterium]
MLSGGSGTHQGPVTFSVAGNSTTQGRTGSLLIGGQSFQVTQDGLACSVSLSNNNSVFPFSAGGGSLGVTVNGSGCEWSAVSSAPWLTIASGASGIGNGTVSFNVADNPPPSGSLSSGARSATISIAGQNAVVNQAGTQCTYTLRSPNSNVPATGGQGALGVVTATGCHWAVDKGGNDWIDVTSDDQGGPATLLFTAAVNSDASNGRTAVLNINQGGTLISTFTITQPAASCAYTLSTPSATLGYGAGSGAVGLSTEALNCSPPVVSFNGWLTASKTWDPATGQGTIAYEAAENPSASLRTGSIQAGDQTFTVNQNGSPCTVNLLAGSADFDHNGGSGTLQFTVSGGACTPSPDWFSWTSELTVNPDSLTSSGGAYSLPYSVSAYQAFVRWIRTPKLTVHGQVFTVKQTSW